MCLAAMVTGKICGANAMTDRDSSADFLPSKWENIPSERGPNKTSEGVNRLQNLQSVVRLMNLMAMMGFDGMGWK